MNEAKSLLMQLRMKMHDKETCNKYFEQHDKDNTEHLSFAQLQALCKELMGHEIDLEYMKCIAAKFDTDNDGRVSRQEFTSWWEGHRTQNAKTIEEALLQ
jgi:Ca2+-binding EF-hand superfamily protein